LRGYLDDDHTPLYPFGYGLSYTTFSFSDIKLEKPVIRNGESTLLSVKVTNNGKRSGHEVVQMYIRDLYSSVSRPVKELKGFKKVFLKPGQSETVKFEIKAEHLAFTNIDMEYVVEPGEFAIMVGNSSRDEDLGKVILKVK
jgi:beta-glucosidase